MRKLHRFWKCLEDRATTASPLARWRLAAGPEFAVLERFLVPAADAVSPVFPCPECGRDLLVVPLGDAIVAEPDADSPCRPVEGLSADDVRAYGVNWSALVRALAASTGLPLDLQEARGGCVCARGDWVQEFRRIAVAARFGDGDRVVSDEALRLMGSRGGALLLTGQHRRDCAELLAGTGCGYAALEDVVGVDEDGRLVCGCDLATRLAPLPVCRESGHAAAGKKEWVFVDEGASFRVVLPEGEFTMPKRTGEKYLHWFARNPRREHRVLDVVSQVRGTGGRKMLAERTDEDAGEAVPAKGAVHVNGVTTRETVQDLYRDLKAIKSQRDRAENDGDAERVRELDTEVAAIEDQLSRDTNRFGKIRKTTDDGGKAAASIQRELDRAYARLLKAKGPGPARMAFAEHFKRQLAIGYTCRYDIPMERDWVVMKK